MESRLSAAPRSDAPAGWALVATGDFNKDGKPDYVLYNASTRQTVIWYLNNNVRIAGAAVGPTLPAAWSLVGVADFNRDGKPDYLLFNPRPVRQRSGICLNNLRIGSAVGPTLPGGWIVVGGGRF